MVQTTMFTSTYIEHKSNTIIRFPKYPYWLNLPMRFIFMGKEYSLKKVKIKGVPMRTLICKYALSTKLVMVILFAPFSLAKDKATVLANEHSRHLKVLRN